MLNAPRRTPAADVMTRNATVETPDAAPASQAASFQGAPPAAPGGTPDTAAKPAAGDAAADKKDAAAEDEVDKDPYEGVAPEELPPDLQYSADSSVSFPTNI